MSQQGEYLASSPIKVEQKDLIKLSRVAKVIPLNAVHIKSLQAGSYVSHFKGRGMEFDESRPYQPGDDPRNIDWRVTARSSQAYTKLFREERERPVYVVTDLRSNMHFATQGSFKSVIASYAASCIAWAAHHRGDRLGGIIFGDSFCAEIKPRLGRQAALRYLHNISNHPDWETSISENESTQEESYLKAVTALRRVVRPGSLVVIISDFLGFSRMSRSHIARLSQHNEILAIFVSDPMEEIPPPAGRYRIVCADEDISVDTYSKRAREKYSHTFKVRKSDTYDFFRRYGIHRMAISTSDDPIEELKRSLGKKNR